MCAVPTGTVDAPAPSTQYASSCCAGGRKVLKQGSGCGGAQPPPPPPPPPAHHTISLPCNDDEGGSGGATAATTTAQQQQGGEASYCLFLGAAAEGDSDLCELFGSVGDAAQEQQDARLPRRQTGYAGSPGRGEEAEEAASGVGGDLLARHPPPRGGLYLSSGVAVRLLVAGAALGCLYFA